MRGNEESSDPTVDAIATERKTPLLLSASPECSHAPCRPQPLLDARELIDRIASPPSSRRVFIIHICVWFNVKVREDFRRANTLADETSITNEELKGQLQCVYQERSAVQASVT